MHEQVNREKMPRRKASCILGNGGGWLVIEGKYRFTVIPSSGNFPRNLAWGKYLATGFGSSLESGA